MPMWVPITNRPSFCQGASSPGEQIVIFPGLSIVGPQFLPRDTEGVKSPRIIQKADGLWEGEDGHRGWGGIRSHF